MYTTGNFSPRFPRPYTREKWLSMFNTHFLEKKVCISLTIEPTRLPVNFDPSLEKKIDDQKVLKNNE